MRAERHGRVSQPYLSPHPEVFGHQPARGQQLCGPDTASFGRRNHERPRAVSCQRVSAHSRDLLASPSGGHQSDSNLGRIIEFSPGLTKGEDIVVGQ